MHFLDLANFIDVLHTLLLKVLRFIKHIAHHVLFNQLVPPSHCIFKDISSEHIQEKPHTYTLPEPCLE